MQDYDGDLADFGQCDPNSVTTASHSPRGAAPRSSAPPELPRRSFSGRLAAAAALVITFIALFALLHAITGSRIIRVPTARPLIARGHPGPSRKSVGQTSPRHANRKHNPPNTTRSRRQDATSSRAPDSVVPPAAPARTDVGVVSSASSPAVPSRDPAKAAEEGEGPEFGFER
jgi:hypothetical protein